MTDLFCDQPVNLSVCKIEIPQTNGCNPAFEQHLLTCLRRATHSAHLGKQSYTLWMDGVVEEVSDRIVLGSVWGLQETADDELSIEGEIHEDRLLRWRIPFALSLQSGLMIYAYPELAFDLQFGVVLLSLLSQWHRVPERTYVTNSNGSEELLITTYLCNPGQYPKGSNKESFTADVRRHVRAAPESFREKVNAAHDRLLHNKISTPGFFIDSCPNDYAELGAIETAAFPILDLFSPSISTSLAAPAIWKITVASGPDSRLP